MIQSLRSRLDELEEAERSQQSQGDSVAQRELPPTVDQGARSEHTTGPEAPTQSADTVTAREPSPVNDSDVGMETWLPDDGGAAFSPRPPSPGGHGSNAPGIGLPPTFPTREVDMSGTHPLSSTATLPSSSSLWAGRSPSQTSPSTSTDRRSVERLMGPIDRAISQVSPPLQAPKVSSTPAAPRDERPRMRRTPARLLTWLTEGATFTIGSGRGHVCSPAEMHVRQLSPNNTMDAPTSATGG
jgi:hypothetical protein